MRLRTQYFEIVDRRDVLYSAEALCLRSSFDVESFGLEIGVGGLKRRSSIHESR